MQNDPADRPRPDFSTLHGDALDDALGRFFTLADEAVAVGRGAHARCYTLRKPSNPDHLISEADYVVDERLPYWADLWPSARVLAGALLREEGAGRRLLELGCGLGLDTIAALDAGFDVLATDYYDDATHMTRANAQRNLQREPQVRMVNWRAWPEDIGTFDMVIAADVLYEREYATLVARCIARSLAPVGTALIADPGRLALPAFLEELAGVGLELAHTEQERYEDGPVKQDIRLLRLRHSAATA
jgi:ETFB lysine methyltransferase